MRDFLGDAVRRRPGGTALTDGTRSWSYAELSGLAAGLAAELPGSAEGRACIATLLDPGPTGIAALHAVLRGGALLAPLNPGLGQEALVRALSALRPVVVLTDGARLKDADAAVREAEVGAEVRVVPAELQGVGAEGRGVGGAGRGGADAGSNLRGSGTANTANDHGADPGRAAAVLWTSGTSARSRGVLLSSAAFRHSARASAARLALGPGDRWYASLSAAHVGGLALVTRAALLGSTLVATGPFDAERLSKLIDAGQVTHASLVPTMLLRLLEARGDRPLPSTFRCALVGGAHCPRPLLDRALAAGVPVALTYGMTEATSQVATAPPGLVRRKPGTAGASLAGVELRIGSEGEIQVRGPTLAVGLLEGRASTSSATGAPAPFTGPDGWYTSGDLGEIDQDGHLWVTGRRSLRIITGGVNVDPAEVEEVLLRHSDVVEACVLGLPDPEWGERVVAAVVPRKDRAADLDPEVLQRWSRERLGGPKTPKTVVLLPELPRNFNGKIDRRSLEGLLDGR